MVLKPSQEFHHDPCKLSGSVLQCRDTLQIVDSRLHGLVSQCRIEREARGNCTPMGKGLTSRRSMWWMLSSVVVVVVESPNSAKSYDSNMDTTTTIVVVVSLSPHSCACHHLGHCLCHHVCHPIGDGGNIVAISTSTIASSTIVTTIIVTSATIVVVDVVCATIVVVVVVQLS